MNIEAVRKMRCRVRWRIFCVKYTIFTKNPPFSMREACEEREAVPRNPDLEKSDFTV